MNSFVRVVGARWRRENGRRIILGELDMGALAKKVVKLADGAFVVSLGASQDH